MSLRLTTDQFAERLFATHGEAISLLSEYVSQTVKVKVQCTACDHVWQANPTDVSRGSGCPSCTKPGKKTTREQHVALLDSLFGGRITLVGEYLGQMKRTQYRCECGFEFEGTSHIVASPRKHPCRQCYYAAQRNTDVDGYRRFRVSAQILTNKVYREFEDVINPAGVKRSQMDYHIDHRHSVWEAFYNPIETKAIGLHEVCHPANLRMISQRENNQKWRRSELTATQLRVAIGRFEKEYGHVNF